jgi:hypothetical protein
MGPGFFVSTTRPRAFAVSRQPAMLSSMPTGGNNQFVSTTIHRVRPFCCKNQTVSFTLTHFGTQRSSLCLLESLTFQSKVVPLLPTENRLPIGSQVGWLGFPGIDEDALCFFSGIVSAWRDFRKAYLIDGVAIQGISGGPVVTSNTADGVQIIGAITAYRANRLSGEALPGLSVAQDVSHFHDIIIQMRTFDEANRKKQAIEQQQRGASTTPPEAAPAAVGTTPEN